MIGVALAGHPIDVGAASAPPPPPAKPVPSDSDVAAVGPSSFAFASDPRGAVALAMRPPVLAPLPPGPKPAAPRLTEAELIARAGFQPDQVGFLVHDLETGETVASHNADQAAFIPASVLKVPTAVAARAILGPGHRFRTEVRFEGTRTGPVWNGTLALVGGGDPVLESDDLRRLVATLKAAGLERLDGRFVYDDSALIGAPVIEPTQPPEHAYNPGLSALTLDFNRVRVQWRGDAVDLVKVYGTPVEGVPIRLRRDTDTAGWSRAGPALRHEFAGADARDPGGAVTERWALSPYAPRDGALWLPVKAPAPFVAAVFRAVAAEAGVVLPEPEAAEGPARGVTVAFHRSPRLDVILASGLKHSNNLLAELVGLAATRHLEGRPLALADSAARLETWLAEAMPWVDWTGFHMANHSGLSPASRASPDQLVSILRYAHDQARARGVSPFHALLPDRHFPDPESTVVAAGVRVGSLTPRVAAKSGTVYHGRGLSGIAMGRSGHRLVFAVFTSDVTARQRFDEGYLHYSGRAVSRARAQLGRARDLEHALLLTWISEH
ncbi:D-alanyl-D-alanine carboxypeptidase/D-alanyl-D-alanine endopeptidase [Rhodospira trueperi]|uniref:D-alanyl-D-alanine carboxypeptidase/D-alanyl-D-alanine endopeptidase n=1 Tax=Rhodospira trueperi TaxID=69960 RepID=UPI00115F9D35|nr:D-alanyl-D-alanine carboxypeptidase/D-alanyl-D-alanine-endopeptidase [Rhodospira trueperi]